MSKYISSEFFKLKKAFSFKIMVIIAFALGAILLATLMATTAMYKNEDMQETLRATYQSQGYSEEEAQTYIELLTEPSAMDMFDSCCGGSNMLLLAGIFVCIFFASDYSSGTIKQITSRGISKEKVFFGKYIVVFAASLILAIVMALVTIGGTGVLFGFGDALDDMAFYVFKYVVAILLSTFTFTSLAFLLTIFTKSMAGSIAGIAIISLVGDIGVLLIEAIFKNKYAIGDYWITTSSVKMADSSISTEKYLQLGGSLLAFGVAFFVIAFLIFRKQEH